MAIAVASGAQPIAGVISGVIGGIVVGALSKSHVSVSGPAAGLTAILVTAMGTLGSYENLLLAVLIAGGIQIILGFIKAGGISNYFPSNVIEGMLAGIGITIFLKQIPKALGSDVEVRSGLSIFSDLINSFSTVHVGVILISVISLIILLVWDKIPVVKNIKLLPAALIVVAIGILVNEFLFKGTSLFIPEKYLVNIPIPKTAEDYKNLLILPNFSAILNTEVWAVGFTIAIVASIESLLCIEAGDKMDPHKRYSDTNVELKAQGIGNIVSALLGGLPMTSVVVRTSANINAGAQSKLSAIIHGILLLLCVVTIPSLLNKIPMGSLAAILLLIGYKLAKPSMFYHFWKEGKYQFIAFIVTVLGVVFLDLLKGVGLGMSVAIFFILRGNMKRAYYFRKEEFHDGDIIHIDLAQEVSFLNKAAIKMTLNHLPEKCKVVINASDTVYISHDVLEVIREFAIRAGEDPDIDLLLLGFKDHYDIPNVSELSNRVSMTNSEHAQLIRYREGSIDTPLEAINTLKGL